MTQAALRPLFEARHFGSSRREPATGELGLFGQRAWCANGAAIETDGSFQDCMSSSLVLLFFNVLASVPRSLTRPPGVPRRFCRMSRISTRHFAFG